MRSPGLSILRDVVSPDEIARLIAAIATMPKGELEGVRMGFTATDRHMPAIVAEAITRRENALRKLRLM